MAFRAIILAVLAAAAAAAAASSEAGGGLSFHVINEAAHTSGGQRFEAYVGAAHVLQILEDASNTAWTMLGQRTSPDERRPVKAITVLVVDGLHGGRSVATSRSGLIQINARDIWNYKGDILAEVTGILYREVCKIWQSDGQGRANSGLVDGVADLARIRSGFIPAGWAQPGAGTKWDQQGVGITARFLDHVDKQQHMRFIAALNAGLNKPTTGEQIFKEVTGKTVDQLWVAYKAAYAGA